MVNLSNLIYFQALLTTTLPPDDVAARGRTGLAADESPLLPRRCFVVAACW